jgi:hypothetical protein
MITDDFIIRVDGHITRPVKELKNWNEHNGYVKPDGGYLPASHPYWTVNYMKGDVERYDRHSKQLEECKQNPELIKVYYNSTTTIKQIESRVNEYKTAVYILKHLNII